MGHQFNSQETAVSTAEQAPRGWRSSIVVKCVLAAVFVFGIAALYPIGSSRSVVAPEGSVWNGDDVIAEFSFPIGRSEVIYAHEVDSAVAAVPPVFVLEARVEDSSMTAVHAILDLLKNPGSDTIPRTLNPSQRQTLIDALHAARSVAPGRDELALFARDCNAFLWNAYQHGIINIGKQTLQAQSIAVRQGHRETLVPVDSTFDAAESASRLRIVLARHGVTDTLQNLAIVAVRSYIAPNMIFDSVATMLDRRAAAAAVPRTEGIVARGERIIARGERIEAEQLARLNAYQSARTIRGEEHMLPRYAGAALHLMLILALVLFYLYTLRRRLLADNQQLLIFTLIVVIEAVLTSLSMHIGGSLPMEYLIVVPTAAMLGTIMFDSRTGFFFAVVIALIVAGIRGNDFVVALGALVAGGLAAYTVRDIRSRTQLFKSIGYIFAGYAFTIAASALEHSTPTARVLMETAFALLNAVISPVLTLGLLLAFERVFHLTSDLTLLEFDNINHPLLKELSTSAPGTFHHTMVIADMAERAANAIGANAMLAKVGAYYHDIGKIESPEFFVENQLGIRNKHERLTPLHSAKIIMQHVPDGLALARRYNLPQKIADFIPMHHGTTMIAYFYDRALRRRRREDVRENDYRYAGPKPRSKEAAIVMLADSVEATIRSMETIDEPTIEKIVERTIRNRFLEGQLDESEITAADLIAARDQFVEILVGIHHPRIKYPDQQAAEQAIPAPDGGTHENGAPTEQQDIPPPMDMSAEQSAPHEDPL